MTWETCYTCGQSGETDDDEGGVWEGNSYTCSWCVKKLFEKAEEPEPPGDPWEEMQIRNRHGE